MAQMMKFGGDFCGMNWRRYFLGGTFRGVLEVTLISLAFLESEWSSVCESYGGFF